MRADYIPPSKAELMISMQQYLDLHGDCRALFNQASGKPTPIRVLHGIDPICVECDLAQICLLSTLITAKTWFCFHAYAFNFASHMAFVDLCRKRASFLLDSGKRSDYKADKAMQLIHKPRCGVGDGGLCKGGSKSRQE